MSNVLQFLEMMGSNASAARMTTFDFERAIQMLDADESAKSALRDRDEARLSEALNGRPMMYCLICAPDDDQKGGDQENEQDDPKEGGNPVEE